MQSTSALLGLEGLAKFLYALTTDCINRTLSTIGSRITDNQDLHKTARNWENQPALYGDLVFMEAARCNISDPLDWSVWSSIIFCNIKKYIYCNYISH